jgi:hypothetical protein
MMNINLLPRVPLIKKVFLPALIAIITIFSVLILTISVSSLQMKLENAETSVQINALESSLTEIQQEKIAEPIVKDYNELSAVIQALDVTRYAWKQVIQDISNLLPSDSRVLSMSLSADHKLMIDMQSKDMEAMAQYMDRLGRLPYFNKIQLNTITQEEIFYRPVEEEADTPTDENLGQLTFEQLLDNLKAQVPASQSEQDEALNELQWLVQQEVAKDQLGITLPDESFEWEKPPLHSAAEDIITPEEWSKAAAKLQQLKSLEIAGATDSTEVEGTTEQDTSLTVYRGQFQLELKPSVEK